MTAVASPPTLQSLPRLGWNSSGSGGQGALSAEDVSRMFVPKKGPQRQNSSSSLSSTSSTSSKTSESTITSPDSKARKEPLNAEGKKEGWTSSKFGRGFWPQAKQEVSTSTTSTATLNGRPQVNGTTPSSPATVPPSSPIHQTTPLVPTQKMVAPPPQANGVRMPVPAAAGSDPPALLILLPMNATFERKQINVPQFPEILRIGRQTNAKTVPTPTNGYFDSKVLSRQHAEVWADRSGKIWIRDVKSSNGTFVNGMRLSPESRDSEPHELRENDVLELGIDIVSEDQKSIVHHKVSAKVEHAGIPTNATSVLDLNLGDIEPGSGGGLSMLPQNVQMRGRLGSQGSIGSNGRGYGIGPNNVNSLGVQRHMGAWISPVTIEQVVKRLTVELRQAKQQSQELSRAGDYVNALLNTEPGQEVPKPPADILPVAPVMNGISPQKGELVSPFSQPPAPPPQLPLPEKPDIARSMHSESSIAIGLKRLETEKAQAMDNMSANKLESPSSQISSLMLALTTTRKDLESQGNRVKQLEEQLRQERRARESAEERARYLQDRSKIMSNGPDMTEDDAVSTNSEDSHITTIHCPEDTDSTSADVTVPTVLDSHKDTEKMDSSASRLQERLNLMLHQMEEMKAQMEFHKRRAETAEEERTSLADMVERIRQGQPRAKSRERSLKKKRSRDMATETEAGPLANGSAYPTDRAKHGDEQGALKEANGTADKSRAQATQLQNAIATALTLPKDDRLVQSAPYASILGVVLIGVGIMTYLNGWQKIDR